MVHYKVSYSLCLFPAPVYMETAWTALTVLPVDVTLVTLGLTASIGLTPVSQGHVGMAPHARSCKDSINVTVHMDTLDHDVR